MDNNNYNNYNNSDDKGNGYETNADAKNEAHLKQLYKRIAQLEEENARLKQYFSSLSKNKTTTASQDPPLSPNIAVDIEELRREHYRFYQALMTSNSGISIQCGPAHIFQFANSAYERVVGRGSERLVGLSAQEAFPEAEDQGFFELTDAVVRTGKPFTAKELPVKLARLEGGGVEACFFTFTASPLFNIEGEVEGFITHGVEVTQEVRTAQALQHERQLLRNVFEHAPAAIAIVSGPNQVFELANEKFLQLIGRKTPIIGLSHLEAFPEIENQGFAELLDEVYRTGKPFVGNEIPAMLDLTGEGKLEEAFFNFIYQPITGVGESLGDDGDNSSKGAGVESIFIHGVNVTEQVVARQEIEKLSRLKDNFLAIASHDLRTPITAIKGYIQLLQQNLLRQQQTYLSVVGTTTATDTVAATDNAASDVQLKYFEKNLKAVGTVLIQINRLNNLLTRLLDFSSISEGHLSLKYSEKADLLELVQDVVANFNMTNENHRVVLQTPGVGRGITLAYDEDRMEQVLNNLINNALKYSPVGSTVTVGVEVPLMSPASGDNSTNISSSSSNGDSSNGGGSSNGDGNKLPSEVVVWVRDEGIGISPEDQQYLFDRFYRVQNEQTSKQSGMGLGLFICQGIIKQHGGRLWVESEYGKGSTFFMALPNKVQSI